MKVIFLISLLFFGACGSDDDEGISSRQEEESFEKSLFSPWTNREDSSSFDLTNVSFESPGSTDFFLNSGETCSCSVLIRGSQSSGTMEVFNCFYSGGGPRDPDCDALWENGRRPYEYINAERIMELCRSPGLCETYR